ncbi:ATP-dependent DNA helicase DinG [Melaminivora jejuensis]|uniref:ATP-dependent DNA helicase DinG n=1 Tax=Melaminivora jejuensis TaxID=1267217 RepID=UPI001AE0CBE0|nr:ATP-dependent DNA helicase DinG [Melaminivora jejuensis]UHJ64956.1 ATP-dependent DNA helicase DinG [Melaminivora jejuensis]
MSTQQWADEALHSFEAVVQASAGFRAREGQRRMAEQVAQTFAGAELGKAEDEAHEPQRAIAVIQAGTGVGKSLAYSAPAVALALARGTRVLISTATVALQEQLVHKDLPALAEHLQQPVRFALAKGRGRYVCKLKLERLAGGGSDDDDEWSGTDDLFGPAESAQPATRQAQLSRVQFYASMADALSSGEWDGDRDTLATPPEPEAWSPVAAEAHSCTGKHCPLFSRCTYYDRRRELVAAQVIVANHDLLLSSIGARLLPELDNCLLIVDEAHHLPGTALSQFACEADLSRLAWIDKLASRALRIGQALEVEEIADIPNHSARLRAALQDAARLVADVYGSALKAAPRFGSAAGQPARTRVAGGVLPEALAEPFQQVVQHAEGFAAALRAISKALRTAMRDNPDESRRLSQLYAQVGTLAPRLDGVYACAQLLLQDAPEGAVPAAKWFTQAVEGDYITLRAHASPVLPGHALRQHLWAQVRGAVLTSATLASCGQFDFFLREAGLAGDPAVQTLAVDSPFDYARQGTLVARETRAEPRDVQQFTAEMVDALLTDLALVEAGALVLFTSREQMRRAVDELPTVLRASVLVQGQLPRRELLARHRQQVAAGQPSIIFGMQSFGEGLDLPGQLCESLFITKLPFAPPDDPVGEARAEWLRAAGRDPFSELVVPATAIRLAQWVGRAIRTEDDRAHVYCYDKRLVRTGYGQRLLAGLPPFALQRG